MYRGKQPIIIPHDLLRRTDLLYESWPASRLSAQCGALSCKIWHLTRPLVFGALQGVADEGNASLTGAADQSDFNQPGIPGAVAPQLGADDQHLVLLGRSRGIEVEVRDALELDEYSMPTASHKAV